MWFHNYMLVQLDNGKWYKLEKNETVIEKPAIASDFKNKLFDVPLKGKELSVKDMISTASAGNTARFYKYRSDSDNCQRFTRDIVEKNGLLPDDIEGTKRFHVQDAMKLSDSLLPETRAIPDAVTDFAAIVDRAVHGDGVDQKRAFRDALFGGAVVGGWGSSWGKPVRDSVLSFADAERNAMRKSMWGGAGQVKAQQGGGWGDRNPGFRSRDPIIPYY